MFTRCGRHKIISAILVLGALVIVPASMSIAQSASTQSASPLGNKDAGKVETAIGDLVADTLRSYVRSDVAFVAASEMKPKDTPIPAGQVQSSAITELISYQDDPLAVLGLTGAQIRQALEKAVSIYDWSNMAFLQVSGLEFQFQASGKPGERVTSITVGGAPIDAARTYSVAVTNSMANGALGYWKVWSAENIVRRLPDATLIKAVDSYFTANAKIDYSVLNRISVK